MPFSRDILSSVQLALLAVLNTGREIHAIPRSVQSTCLLVPSGLRLRMLFLLLQVAGLSAGGA